MARTIGTANIKKIKKICGLTVAKHTDKLGNLNYNDAREDIINQIPSVTYRIWESAHDEIERIVGDWLTAYSHRR